ncbi:hypothetical protein MMC07_009221 [Pseudocyphellaria aurata]|nr:hypothetical protein [Pseudocyphellaria aurata]
MVFGASITATKISILCLYYRLFATPLFRHATILLGVFCVLWLIATEIAILLLCMRVTDDEYSQLLFFGSFNWNCYFLSINITETILDFAILVLPLGVVSSLQLPLRQKMVLYLTFLVGGFVCITGIVRTVLTYPQRNDASAPQNSILWTNAQLGTSIVCACLPIYRPLLIKCAAISSSISNYLTPLNSTAPSPPPGDSRTRPRYTTHFAALHDDQSQSRLTRVTGGALATKGGGRGRGGRGPVVADPNVPLHSISVRSSIEIV